ncbi:GIY-YIG nuclease family protein [Virgibacillus sp. AGTR]|uniref:GIY-YIG nuclease family protein n=1 Tax=Virgibacillus sp. AGTR TaxID=2812055 RepID=UPI001D16D1CC|nr:GIY-YIG nuclease family protein [Virgibacillus sp. AGTR]MCC2252747.1 GIY-YIG nuclease family protein [Virgibacillus sp. AGTR]
MYLYRFINQHSKIIYIGRTNNVIRRLRNEHFTNRGHLPEACYNETVTIEVATTTSLNEAKMYELYYIEKYHPKYNQSDIGGGTFSFELKDLTWETFNFHTDKNNKTKQEILSFLDEKTPSSSKARVEMNRVFLFQMICKNTE